MQVLETVQENCNPLDRLMFNLVPRLSSLRSSLEEETLVDAGHVAPRFRKPFGYALLVRGGFVGFLGKCNSCYTFHQM